MGSNGQQERTALNRKKTENSNNNGKDEGDR
jgi:hypothetical protein